MRTRILGITLIVLTAFAGLNLARNLFGFWNGPASVDADVKWTKLDMPPIPPVPPIPPIPPVPGFFADGEGEVMIERSFDVTVGQLLAIDVQHSDIEIETGDVSQARVIVTLESPDMDEAREKFDAMHFEAGQTGSEVWLRSRSDENVFSGNGWSRVRMSIAVHVVIPMEFDVRMKSTHGDVVMGSLHGDAEINTTHGDVVTGDLAGDRISIHSTHGDVVASRLDATELDVVTTHGDLMFGSVVSADFEAQTSHSDVVVTSLTGSAVLNTTHGDVAVNVQKTEGLSVHTTHGNVELELPGAQRASLDISGDPVSLVGAAKFDGDKSRNRVSGSLNGGGAHIEVSTTFGSVNVASN